MKFDLVPAGRRECSVWNPKPHPVRDVWKALVLRRFFSRIGSRHLSWCGFRKSPPHKVPQRPLFCEDAPVLHRPGLIRRAHITGLEDSESNYGGRKRRRCEHAVPVLQQHVLFLLCWIVQAGVVPSSCFKLICALQADVAEWERQKRQRIHNIARAKQEPEYRISEVIGPRERTPDPAEAISRRHWNSKFRRWRRGWRPRPGEEVVDLTDDAA